MVYKIESCDGVCNIKYEWFLNHMRHRSNGPAIEYVDGQKEWWLYGIKVTELDVGGECCV